MFWFPSYNSLFQATRRVRYDSEADVTKDGLMSRLLNPSKPGIFVLKIIECLNSEFKSISHNQAVNGISKNKAESSSE